MDLDSGGLPTDPDDFRFGSGKEPQIKLNTVKCFKKVAVMSCGV
jgi:hypothetical protein